MAEKKRRRASSNFSIRAQKYPCTFMFPALKVPSFLVTQSDYGQTATPIGKPVSHFESRSAYTSGMNSPVELGDWGGMP
jgi:hypothetical protein